MNVISYYEGISGLKFSKESEDILELWENSWKNHGWNTIMLNKSHAKASQLYSVIDNSNANFYKSTPSFMQEYHKSCYSRLLAYCEFVRQHGPTLYADYDVLNYGFHPDVLKLTDENSYFLFDRSTVYLGLRGVESIEKAIIDFDKEVVPTNCRGGFTNDMSVITRHSSEFNIKTDDNNNKYSSRININLTNNTPLVHFDGGILQKGRFRKLKYTRLDIINEYNEKHKRFI